MKGTMPTKIYQAEQGKVSCRIYAVASKKPGDLDQVYMFSCSCGFARELRLAAKYKLREMEVEVGRSPEKAESTKTGQEHGLGMREVIHGYNLATVKLAAAMGKIFARKLHVDGIYTTAVLRYQSYAMVIPTTAMYNATKCAMLTTLQQDTHQEYCLH